MGKLEGKVAVVTGGSSGLGRAIARRFVAEGARVVIGDIADEAGQEVADSLGDSARFRHCDVTRADDIEALVRTAPAEWGRLDIMVNNAGAVGARGSILDITPDEWGATMSLLLNSVFFGIRSAGRVMVDQGEGGSIISMASIAAFTPGNGPHVYGTAKAAVVHLTQRVSLELGEQRIRVNAICPGFINTNIFTASLEVPGEFKTQANAVIAEMSANAQPVARGGQPEDIANAVAYLASEESSFMTGTHLLVDGGLTIGQRHAWDKETPGMFDALLAMEEAAKAGTGA